ncbi:MAG: hypothetical protein IJD36_00885 [Clostridia bacterium]|nr:hypothetical protein [Clostridia bacterium]
MKQGLHLAFVYIGLVIGAGFASGREIIEYFNFTSGTDHSGIVLATFLFILVCYIILERARKYSLYSCNDYLKALTGRFIVPVKIFMIFYLFCGFFTMLAGSGALLSQSYMLPTGFGIFLLAIICLFVLIFNLKGIVVFNTILVPCMLLGIVYICIDSSLFGTCSVFSFHGLTRGILTSAICYVSYNTISAASVLVPLQKGISKKGVRVASYTGGIVLGFLIFVVWSTQNLHLEALWDSELPMLKLASMSGRLQKHIYTIILFMAICTTAVSQAFGILNFISFKNNKQRISGIVMLCILSIPFAFVGFSALVAHLYSFFGTVGLIWLVWIIADYIKNKAL